MIKLRSKNLVDYDKWKLSSSVTMIENGWQVDKDATYTRRIIKFDSTTYRLKSNVTYYIVFDVEMIDVATSNVGYCNINIIQDQNSFVPSQFVFGIGIQYMKNGNKQRVITKSILTKSTTSTKSDGLYLYNGHNTDANPVNNGSTFKVTNLCFFEEDYTIDYVPYWYEPTKIMTKHNGSMSEVKTIAWGVKDECKLVLNGSEPWEQYRSGSWIGTGCSKKTNAQKLRAAQYNNYWGFIECRNYNKYFWLYATYIYIAWHPGSPPFPSWETTDANGKAIANLPQIKADLAKKNLIVYYDNTNSEPKPLAELLKIVRREVYNNFSATVDSDILTLTNSLVENNVLILPDGKTVTNNVLNL